MPRRTRTTSLTLDLGERIRELRHEAGMSLSQLAKVTGISKGHLSTIELGFAAITVESLERIAKGLELSPTLLMAFPRKDEIAVFIDLLRQLPITDQKRLSKIARQLIKERQKDN